VDCGGQRVRHVSVRGGGSSHMSRVALGTLGCEALKAAGPLPAAAQTARALLSTNQVQRQPAKPCYS